MISLRVSSNKEYVAALIHLFDIPSKLAHTPECYFLIASFKVIFMIIIIIIINRFV